MKYYAHSVKERGEEAWQTICEHAKNTARLCAQFAARWCDETYACDLGLLHDIGKYQPDFQRRIRGENVQIEHAVCGAKECAGYGMGPWAAYCIAGHHAGLPDAGTPVDRADEGTLLGKLKRETQDYGAYRQELQPERIAQPPMRIPLQGGAAANKQIAFWVRMTFSALTDADFLDTERFCNGAPPPPATLDGCLEKLTRAMSGLPAESAVCCARNTLLEQALSHCEEDAHLYLMNMPTGSGKTLASMRFALEQAKRRGLDRVIYVIPYTSIIEQNAAVFRSIFGEDAVLEHHCNFDGDTLENADTAQKLARAAENWDAPVIVTTNVQFFRSVYGNKPSQVRKLHNVANSMLVFDEVHMFPSAFWKPCLEAVKLLVTDYSCRALFLTATMPDFRTWLAQFDCGGMRICDLIGDTSPFGAFERCSVEDAGALSLAQLVAAAAAAQSALIVVNTRRTAKAVYDSLPGEKYHLSTYMTRRDRVRTIGKVREALKEGRTFALVSTSLIEAGVDLDFSLAMRERAGLDNVLQTAGRCNREGKRSRQDCRTLVFDFADEALQTKDAHMRVRRYICRDVMQQYGTGQRAVRAYFDRYFDYYREEMRANDFANSITKYGFAFESYARSFRLIDDDGIGVIVEYPGDAQEEQLIGMLAQGGRAVRRRLQQYAVSLKKYEFDALFAQGVLTCRDGLYFLTNFRYYDADTGIRFRDDSEYIF